MSPTLEQVSAQFGRLVGDASVDAFVGPALAAVPPPPPGLPASGSPTSPTPAVPAVASGEGRAPSPIQATDHAAKGYDLDLAVAPPQVVMVAEILDRAGFALDAITGVDWLAQEQMEVVYDYFHPTTPARVAVRVRVPRAQPELPTITAVYPGANWHEREAHDFFGLGFAGHPDLSPFLLPEDATFHPLRKDYQP